MRAGETRRDFSTQAVAAGEPAPPRPESRALVALSPAAPPYQDTPRQGSPRHRQSAFLAHLLAIKHQHPQTRERRRATPQEAIAAYRAAAALTGR
jgi:hypothetical protein